MIKAFYKMEDTSSMQKIRTLTCSGGPNSVQLMFGYTHPMIPIALPFVVSDFASENSLN
jgi:hypothetical protein